MRRDTRTPGQLLEDLGGTPDGDVSESFDSLPSHGKAAADALSRIATVMGEDAKSTLLAMLQGTNPKAAAALAAARWDAFHGGVAPTTPEMVKAGMAHAGQWPMLVARAKAVFKDYDTLDMVDIAISSLSTLGIGQAIRANKIDRGRQSRTLFIDVAVRIPYSGFLYPTRP